MKMVNNTVIYEALAEQYLHSILDISDIADLETERNRNTYIFFSIFPIVLLGKGKKAGEGGREDVKIIYRLFPRRIKHAIIPKI